MCIHICVHTYCCFISTPPPIYVFTCMNTYISIYMHICMMWLDTYTYIYIYTYIYTYIYMYNLHIYIISSGFVRLDL